MRSLIAACLVLLAWGATPTAASEWRVARGEVGVVVPVKPGGSFEARTHSLEGSLSLSGDPPVRLAGALRVPLGSIETGIGLRDRHLRERLEVGRGARFDAAVLTAIELPAAKGEGFEGDTPFSGTLLLHDVERRVEGDANIGRRGTSAWVSASFVLRLSDFGIDAPSYMGVGVQDRLIVEVTLLMEPAEEDGGKGR